MATAKTDPRTRLIRLIHVARRELQMDDDSYRQMLSNIPALGGRTSSADLGLKGLELVMAQLKAKGFVVRAKVSKAPKKSIAQQSRSLADDAQSKKIRSLWLELHDAGVVRDPSESALANYVCRVAKIEALQWLNTSQASNVIETLKKWLHRTISSVDVKNREFNAK